MRSSPSILREQELGAKNSDRAGDQPPTDTRARGFKLSVPLAIAGPKVVQPGRRLEVMVNLSDLFSLFREIAGIDVKKIVPKSHVLDTEKMMAYLTTLNARPIRTINFALQGNNMTGGGTVVHPCVIPNLGQCTYSLPMESLCRDQGGTWYGSYTSCCQVQGVSDVIYFSSIESKSIRNSKYKLFQQVAESCSKGQAVQPNTQYNEFYEVDQAVPEPKLDKPELNLIANGLGGLSGEQRRNYDGLMARLNKLEASMVPCPGDVNLDGRVNRKDLEAWESIATTVPGKATENGGGKGSWADFSGPADSTRPDGMTDSYDRNIILANLGKRCG